MNIRRVATILTVVLLSAGFASASPVSFQVHVSGLNKLASAVGPISGDAGSYPIIFNPCGIWGGNCNIVICPSGTPELYWTLNNVNFQIGPPGATFTGQLSLSYCGLNYSTNVAGSASAAFQQLPAAVKVSLSNISVPVQFNLPIVGNITITTLTLSEPPYTFYINPAVFTQPIRNPATIYAQITQATISYGTGYVQMDCEVSTW